MHFLANENFPGDAVTALQAAGHDVVWVRLAAPGSKDDDILAWAVREGRVLLTFDKDFGELAWRVGLPASSGVVLFRLPMPPAAGAGAVLTAKIEERNDGQGISRSSSRAASGCGNSRNNKRSTVMAASW
jgi:predicted nuclease of predicted toxin-antitoxin system